jgi:uncharacterized protein YeaC (DUF1315 family)
MYNKFLTSLTTLEWQKKIGILLSEEPDQVNLTENRKEICLQLMASKNVENSEIDEFIDVFQVRDYNSESY